MPNTNSSSKSFYITTPIYYVNDSPHIGHAYTTIACDVMARFKRLDGYKVKFLTGTDEHGQKVDKAAKAKNIAPQAFTDEVSLRFRNLVNSGENLLNISNDDFIRTTEERHKIATAELWKRMETNGHIYLGVYEGWYSVRDEAYYQADEIVEKDGKKIAPGSGSEVEWVKQESYFFDLSKWQQKLLEFYDAHPDFIKPEERYNEVKSFVRGGKEFVSGALKDLSISRNNFSWGIKIPAKPEHVMYVWVDALANYLTAVGFPDINHEQYQQFWNSDSKISPLHVVGKDIIRFHGVYWPAFLMAAGLPLPKRIIAHGWWTIEGEKMSKSLGNVVEPKTMVDKFGLDSLRYFLMREVPFGNDGNFAANGLVERVNAELANNIGNLAQRTLAMVQKNCDGVVPKVEDANEVNDLIARAESAKSKMEQILSDENMNFSAALEEILHLASNANRYIDEKAPWALKKQGKITEMEQVLYVLLQTVKIIAILLQPFIPGSAKKILLQLGFNEADFDNAAGGIAFSEIDNRLKPGTKLPAPVGVFPRITLD